jgi:hypothetical protein
VSKEMLVALLERIDRLRCAARRKRRMTRAASKPLTEEGKSCMCWQRSDSVCKVKSAWLRWLKARKTAARTSPTPRDISGTW